VQAEHDSRLFLLVVALTFPRMGTGQPAWRLGRSSGSEASDCDGGAPIHYGGALTQPVLDPEKLKQYTRPIMCGSWQSSRLGGLRQFTSPLQRATRRPRATAHGYAGGGRRGSNRPIATRNWRMKAQTFRSKATPRSRSDTNPSPATIRWSRSCMSSSRPAASASAVRRGRPGLVSSRQRDGSWRRGRLERPKGNNCRPKLKSAGKHPIIKGA